MQGQVSAVQAAVEAAVAGAIKTPVAHAVIANPHSETARMAQLSAKRIQQKNAPAKEQSDAYLKEV